MVVWAKRKRSLCIALIYLRGDKVLINVRDSSINCFFFPVIKFILYFVEHFCWLAEMTINHCVINLINGVFMKCNLFLNHVSLNESIYLTCKRTCQHNTNIPKGIVLTNCMFLFFFNLEGLIQPPVHHLPQRASRVEHTARLFSSSAIACIGRRRT